MATSNAARLTAVDTAVLLVAHTDATDSKVRGATALEAQLASDVCRQARAQKGDYGRGEENAQRQRERAVCKKGMDRAVVSDLMRSAPARRW